MQAPNFYYIEQPDKKKNRLSAYVSTYNTVDLNRPAGIGRENEPGPSSASNDENLNQTITHYENKQGPDSSPNDGELRLSSYENQTELKTSSYENQFRPRTASDKTYSTVKGSAERKHETEAGTIHYEEIRGAGYENQESPGSPSIPGPSSNVHYEEMGANLDQVCKSTYLKGDYLIGGKYSGSKFTG